jgi:hypothetical protein
MKQQGFFDDQICYERLDKTTDPLLRLKDSIDWELFRPELESFQNSSRESRSGTDYPSCVFWICPSMTVYPTPRPSGFFAKISARRT